MRKSIVEQHMSKCVHFNGLAHSKCDVGISYPTISLPTPCFSENANSTQCAPRRFPTEEESKAYSEEVEARLSSLSSLMPILKKIKQEHKGKSWQGTAECPRCHGKLFLSHAALNGHVWGKCETNGCLAWME